MKKKVIAAIGFCGLVLSQPASGMMVYEIQNGFFGVGKNPIAKILARVRITYDVEKIRNVRTIFGMGHELYFLKTHYCFTESLKGYNQPCKPTLEALKQFGVRQMTDLYYGYERGEIEALCVALGLSGKTFRELVEIRGATDYKTLDNKTKAAHNHAWKKMKTDNVVTDFRTMLQERPDAFIFQQPALSAFIIYANISAIQCREILMILPMTAFTRLQPKYIVALGDYEKAHFKLLARLITLPTEQLWMIAAWDEMARVKREQTGIFLMNELEESAKNGPLDPVRQALLDQARKMYKKK